MERTNRDTVPMRRFRIFRKDYENYSQYRGALKYWRDAGCSICRVSGGVEVTKPDRIVPSSSWRF